MPIIKIDDVEYDVAPNQNLVTAAASVGIEIPHYCYHPGLSVSGNCRMCLVEVKGPRGTMAQIACNTPIAENLEIYTQTPTVKKMREGVMEFLLLNHPIDCPICDQAGECGLQNYYMDYGLYSNRSTVPKVNKEKVVDVGPQVVLDQERCILCSRCVRFCSEVSKTDELVIVGRGEQCRIDTFPGKKLDNDYSMNVVDVCPVGALTSKDFRFKKRVWWLSTAQSICTGCARGCNINLDFQKETTYRYRPRPNADVNQYWMCDEGRLSYKKLHENRLNSGLSHGQEVPLSVALDQARELLSSTVNQSGKQAVVGVASATASLEDNFLLKHLWQSAGLEQLWGPNFDGWWQADNLLKMADKTPNGEGLRFLGIDADGAGLEAALQNGQVKLIVSLDNELAHQGIRELLAQHQVSVIYLGSHVTPQATQAAVALPLTMQAEHYATYINGQKRLQKVNQAYHPKTEAQPGWQLLKELLRPLLTAPALYQDVEDVWTAMRSKYPALGNMTFYDIPETGVALEQEAVVA